MNFHVSRQITQIATVIIREQTYPGSRKCSLALWLRLNYYTPKIGGHRYSNGFHIRLGNRANLGPLRKFLEYCRIVALLLVKEPFYLGSFHLEEIT